MDLLAVFGRTFPIGVMVAAPVGAMSMLCFRRTLEHGPSRGLITGAGIATADGLCASVAAFGLTALSDVLVSWRGWLGLVGGLFLVWLGASALGRSRTADCATPSGSPHPARVYAQTVLLTLANPTTILAFAAVFAGAGIAFEGGPAEATAATLGVASGSALWWVVLVGAASAARRRADERVLRSLSLVSALVLLGFGLVSVVSGARVLLG